MDESFKPIPGANRSVSLPISAPTAWLNQPYKNMHHATATRVVKGEDVLLIEPLLIKAEPPAALFLICDGHAGVDAAHFVASNFLRILNPKLPNQVPKFSSARDMDVFAELVRRAVCETFVRLDNDWAASVHMAGTTVTAILAIGPLLTVANTGDSSAILDTGSSILEMTKSHRIHDSLEEQTRLKAAGCYLAPLGFHLQGPAKPSELGVGPMRLWPGGLCVSRSVGDLDAGTEVIPIPHIRQVLLPPLGCRLVAASDGLWDVLSLAKSVAMVRGKHPTPAVTCLMAAVGRDMRCMDDATIVVLDFVPQHESAFLLTPSQRNGGSHSPPSVNSFSCLSCFGTPSDSEPDSRELNQMDPGHLAYLADIDCFRVYPGIKAGLTRSSVRVLNATSMRAGGGATGGLTDLRGAPPPSRASIDYTLHGGKAYRQGSVPSGLLPARRTSIGSRPKATPSIAPHRSTPLQGAASEVDALPLDLRDTNERIADSKTGAGEGTVALGSRLGLGFSMGGRDSSLGQWLEDEKEGSSHHGEASKKGSKTANTSAPSPPPVADGTTGGGGNGGRGIVQQSSPRVSSSGISLSSRPPVPPKPTSPALLQNSGTDSVEVYASSPRQSKPLPILSLSPSQRSQPGAVATQPEIMSEASPTHGLSPRLIPASVSLQPTPSLLSPEYPILHSVSAVVSPLAHAESSRRFLPPPSPKQSSPHDNGSQQRQIGSIFATQGQQQQSKQQQQQQHHGANDAAPQQQSGGTRTDPVLLHQQEQQQQPWHSNHNTDSRSTAQVTVEQ